MAIFCPRVEDYDRFGSGLNAGEMRVAHELSALDDSWTIYVQPRLAQDVPDFLAVHDLHGVCAVEVKDWSRGRYRQTDGGVIQYTNSKGGWYTTKEKPRYQAHRYRATIFDQFFALPEDADQPTTAVRAVVILPNFSTSDARSLLRQIQVTPAEHTVAVYGGDGFAYLLDKMLRARCPTPDPSSLRRLRRLLAQPSTRADQPARLSRDARDIASNPRQARRRRVRGPAGCGKSFGLAARAARLAAEGRTVLVLSYNATLANYLRALVNDRCREIGADPRHVTCVNFHAFCQRLVDDATHVGVATQAPTGMDWFDALVEQAKQALDCGYEVQFDAVLIDEGQDFTLAWWNMLREHVVVPDGEMLLVADPTQDVYDKRAWTDEERMLGAGFSGPWTELKGSYRMPTDMVPIANAFAARFLDGEQIAGEVPTDHADLVGESAATVRHWENNSRPADHGALIGREVVRLLEHHRELRPADVAFLCESHDDGLDAVRVIEAAGYPVHHIFARNKQARARRKRRFWPDAPGVKGCTVHSFKGWETPALVMGIRSGETSKRLAYVAMTRIRAAGAGRAAYLSVINSDLSIAGFESTFSRWVGWAPPRPENRVTRIPPARIA